MTTSGGTGRLVWVDAARGTAVSLVVLMHFVFWISLPSASADAPVQAWRFFTGVLAPFRMSLLFALAGVLTSRYVVAGWSAKVRTRVTDGVYLYVVWTFIYVAFSLLPLAGLGMPFRGQSAWREFVAPTTPLWFILGLALWTAVLALVGGRVPAWILLPALALVSLAVGWLWPDDVPPRILYYGFFFALGVYGTSWLTTFGGRPKPLLTACCAVTVVVAQLARMAWPAVEPVTDLVAATAGILVALAGVSIACRWRPFATAMSWVGRRTLTVYVLHVPIVVLLGALVAATGVGHTVILTWFGPVLGMVGIVWLCAALHDPISRSSLSFLLRPPRVLRPERRPTRDDSPAPS